MVTGFYEVLPPQGYQRGTNSKEIERQWHREKSNSTSSSRSKNTRVNHVNVSKFPAALTHF
jgi:hypothetical protein